jgi:hypothetical protein
LVLCIERSRVAASVIDAQLNPRSPQERERTTTCFVRQRTLRAGDAKRTSNKQVGAPAISGRGKGLPIRATAFSELPAHRVNINNGLAFAFISWIGGEVLCSLFQFTLVPQK